MKLRRPVLTVTAMVAIVAVGSATAAGAHSLITSSDIKNNSVAGKDIKNGSVTSKDIKNGSLTGADVQDGSLNLNDLSAAAVQALAAQAKGATGATGAAGAVGAIGATGATGAAGADGADGKDATYVGPHWGELDRNTTPGASATLRSGPYAGATLQPASGVGSLQISAAANTKVDFGNEVDFAGDKVADLAKLSYYVYTTGENVTAGGVTNLPVLRIEVNAGTLKSGVVKGYSTLVFAPNGTGVTPSTFSKIDATDDAAGGWYFTGGVGTATGCTLTTQCTLATINDLAPNAVIGTLSVGKGTDSIPFVGAVDDLQVNGKVYDFEPFGVYTHDAS